MPRPLPAASRPASAPPASALPASARLASVLPASARLASVLLASARPASVLLASVLLLAGCAAREADEPPPDPARQAAAEPGISADAAALLARGDAARMQADRLRAEAAAIEDGLAGLPAPDRAARAARADRLAALEAEAVRLEQAAADLWQQAQALDRDAGPAVLARMLGGVPED
ncbi:hypothetical protein [Paralimibaculum aggregatum]|nr:hypothetical protein [Limibaculum sp. NKW23]